VTEARLMTDEHLPRTERVGIRALCRRAGDPLPGSGLHQLAQHKAKRMTLS
jgi:hypothetical protein